MRRFMPTGAMRSISRWLCSESFWMKIYADILLLAEGKTYNGSHGRKRRSKLIRCTKPRWGGLYRGKPLPERLL